MKITSYYKKHFLATWWESQTHVYTFAISFPNLSRNGWFEHS